MGLETVVEPILDYVVVYGIFVYLGVNFIYLLRRPMVRRGSPDRWTKQG